MSVASTEVVPEPAGGGTGVAPGARPRDLRASTAPSRARRMDRRPRPRLRPLAEVLAELGRRPAADRWRLAGAQRGRGRARLGRRPRDGGRPGGSAGRRAAHRGGRGARRAPAARAPRAPLPAVARSDHVRATVVRAAPGLPGRARVRGLRVCPVVGRAGPDGAGDARRRGGGGACAARSATRAAAARFELDDTPHVAGHRAHRAVSAPRSGAVSSAWAPRGTACTCGPEPQGHGALRDGVSSRRACCGLAGRRPAPLATVRAPTGRPRRGPSSSSCCGRCPPSPAPRKAFGTGAAAELRHRRTRRGGRVLGRRAAPGPAAGARRALPPRRPVGHRRAVPTAVAVRARTAGTVVPGWDGRSVGAGACWACAAGIACGRLEPGTARVRRHHHRRPGPAAAPDRPAPARPAASGRRSAPRPPSRAGAGPGRPGGWPAASRSRSCGLAPGTASTGGGLLDLDGQVEQEADGLLADALHHRGEHLEALALVLDLRVALGHGAQPDALLEVVHLVEVLAPLAVEHGEDHLALELAHPALGHDARRSRPRGAGRRRARPR